MSNVSQEIFINTTTQLGESLRMLETRLNELFTKFETKIGEHASLINGMENKVGIVVEQLQQQSGMMDPMSADVPAQMKALLDENKNLVMDKAGQMDILRQQTTSWVNEIQTEMNNLTSEVGRIGSMQGNSGPSGPRQDKGLVNAKDFTLKIYDGEAHNKMNWEEWREDLEDFIETVRSNAKVIMEKSSRWPEEITASNFNQVVAAAGLREQDLTWTYEKVDAELYTFVKKYISGKARKAFKSTQLGGFDGYRLLIWGSRANQSSYQGDVVGFNHRHDPKGSVQRCSRIEESAHGHTIGDQELQEEDQ